MNTQTDIQVDLKSPQNFDSDLLTKQTQSLPLHSTRKGPANLNELWQAVQESYDSEWRHQEFILACYRSGCLYFAAQKYARILNTSPTESIAVKMQEQIEALMMKDRFAKPSEKTESRPSNLSGFVAVIGLLIAAMGFISVNFRNLFGVGIAIFALAIGLRFFVSKPNQ